MLKKDDRIFGRTVAMELNPEQIAQVSGGYESWYNNADNGVTPGVGEICRMRTKCAVDDQDMQACRIVLDDC